MNPAPIQNVKTPWKLIRTDLYCDKCGCQSHVRLNCPYVITGDRLVKVKK